jgi:hypothetical protein
LAGGGGGSSYGNSSLGRVVTATERNTARVEISYQPGGVPTHIEILFSSPSPVVAYVGLPVAVRVMLLNGDGQRLRDITCATATRINLNPSGCRPTGPWDLTFRSPGRQTISATGQDPVSKVMFHATAYVDVRARS